MKHAQFKMAPGSGHCRDDSRWPTTDADDCPRPSYNSIKTGHHYEKKHNQVAGERFMQPLGDKCELFSTGLGGFSSLKGCERAIFRQGTFANYFGFL